MKHFICILLIIFLFLTGCRSQEAATESTLPVPDSLKGVTFDKNIKISVGFWNIQDMINCNTKDPILNNIEKLFNITLEPISVNWSDYKERYQVLSATKSLPDIFANLTISSSDSIRSLPKDLSKFPNIEALLRKLDSNKYSDGNFYIIPRLSFTNPILATSDAGMLVRKDWMANLGLSKPQSLEEFTDMVTAFAKDDPDKDGLNNTIGYNVNNRIALGKWLILGIAPECNANTWIHTKDGYIPSYLSKDFKKVVAAYRTLYERGALDPDFYIKKSSDAVDDFAHGRLGALEYKTSPAAIMELKAQWDLYQDKPFEDCVDVLNIFPADDSRCYSNSSSLFWSVTLFSSNVDDEKMERILYLFDYLLSEEGMQLTRYGLKGEDYTFKDGEYQCLTDTGTATLTESLAKKYPSLLLFGSLATWGGTEIDFEVNKMNTLRYGNYIMKLSNEALQWNISHTVQVERPYDFFLMQKENTQLFNTEAVMNDFTRVIIGTGDPVKMWDSIIEGYYKNGLSEYIQRRNKLYEEYSKR